MEPIKTNRYGTHKEVHIGVFKLDRIGIYMGSAQRHIFERADAPGFDTYLRLSAAPVVGIPAVNVERSYDEDKGMAIYTYSYEGVTEEHTFGDDQVTYELDTTMSEEPIETHPSFGELKEKYGWSSARREFAEFPPEGAASGGSALPGTGGQGQSRATGKRSELYGVDSYLVVGAVFRRTYARRTVPTGIFQGIGTVMTVVPGLVEVNFRAAARGRTWLKMIPRVRKRGNAVEISEAAMMSGPKGWVRDVYGAGQLDR